MLKTVLISLFLLLAFQSLADWPEEERKIEFLLNEISRLDAVFIRNDSEYTPDEAVRHLRMKLQSGLKSWFAPAKEKWTAELFIDKIASKSSLSGKPYQIRFKDGVTRLSRAWLTEKLRKWPSTP